MSILLDVENLANSCINDEIEREFMINGLIDILVRIPTCTATERAFLDEIREKFEVSEDYKDDPDFVIHVAVGNSQLWQTDFKTSLKELVNEPTKKQICPLCDEPYDSIEHETSCQLFGGQTMTPKQKLIEKVKEIRKPVGGVKYEFAQWEKGYESACTRVLELIEEILP